MRTLYKTSENIIAEAKRTGKEYIPCNYDFEDNRQRFITAERREALAVLQQKLFHGDFDAFLDEIYAMGLPQEVISAFEDAYYGKPLYALTVIGSGAPIRLDAVLDGLKSANGDTVKQKTIAEDLSAQLCAAAMRGLIRDYFSTLISRQTGCEGKASRTLIGYYGNFRKLAAIYTGVDFTNDVYVSFLRLIENIKTDLKLIRSYDCDKITPEQWLKHTLHSCKLLEEYTNEYMNKVRK